MNCFAFELRRWFRHFTFVATFLALVVLGGVMSWLNPEPAMPFFAPLFAVFVAAGDTAQGLRRGCWDFLVSRGPSLQSWLMTRFALAVSVGNLLLVAHLGAGVASGSASAAQGLAWVNTLLYWSGAGVALGFWLSGAAAVTLAVLTTALSNWWMLSGCLWLTGVPAQELPWLSKGLVALFGIVPVGELPSRLGPSRWGWEALRLLAALGFLVLALRQATRRPLFVREEG